MTQSIFVQDSRKRSLRVWSVIVGFIPLFVLILSLFGVETTEEELTPILSAIFLGLGALGTLVQMILAGTSKARDKRPMSKQ